MCLSRLADEMVTSPDKTSRLKINCLKFSARDDQNALFDLFDASASRVCIFVTNISFAFFTIHV
jgi:hypothetical protein